MHHNYLDCPNFKATAECEESKKFVSSEPCGYFEGEKRIIGIDFWYDWSVE